jgi:hypothetical protein
MKNLGAVGDCRAVLPEAEGGCASVVTLPGYPGMRDEHVDIVGGEIRRWHFP